ncbi:transaldolase [Sulfurospirillum diekertiae]|uniref:Transaldolase n=1 Tax=Sulfurospirillum diekertiae TaxID=1854492 RepID=A0A290HAD3_9BACT|nr:transaldolase [Sulfurospirillum diekertiae]
MPSIFSAFYLSFARCLVKKGTKKLPQAVISIFVSRFDRKLDEHFKKIDFVLSRVGIMNAMRAYELIQNAQLPNVRALFASTGVKGDELSPDYYIRELLLPNSINTAPLGTIKAFIGSSKECESIELRSDWIENFFHSLAANGVDMNAVCDELMDEGLSAFKDAFVEILDELK